MSATLKHRGDKSLKNKGIAVRCECRDTGRDLSTGILHPRPVIAASFVAGGYWVSREPIRVTTRAAIAVSTVRSITLAKLYISDTLLEWFAQDLEDMASELG